MSPTLQPRLTAALQSYRYPDYYITTIKVIGVNPAQTSVATLATQAAAAQKASFDYWTISAQELDGFAQFAYQ